MSRVLFSSEQLFPYELWIFPSAWLLFSNFHVRRFRTLNQKVNMVNGSKYSCTTRYTVCNMLHRASCTVLMYGSAKRHTATQQQAGRKPSSRILCQKGVRKRERISSPPMASCSFVFHLMSCQAERLGALVVLSPCRLQSCHLWHMCILFVLISGPCDGLGLGLHVQEVFGVNVERLIVVDEKTPSGAVCYL